MPRLFAALTILLFASSARAVIDRPVALADILKSEEFIFAAKVERVAPEKPAVVLAVTGNLKGKAPFERLAVNLTGDAEAKRKDHLKMMLDRLAPGRKLVGFCSKQGNGYSCYCFLEGTWFQLKGTRDGDAVRWAFLHGEPYLRRTFKGTTDELQTIVAECLAGKRKPPALDPKEPPGYGPPLGKKCGMRNAELGMRNEIKTASSIPPSEFRIPHSRQSALFAVIPSFVLVGPLAVIAALFPGVFARLAVVLTRWRAFLAVASFNSTLAVAQYAGREWRLFPDAWVFSPRAFALVMLVASALGLVWAGVRYRRIAAVEPGVTAAPAKSEIVTLLLLTGLLALFVGGTGVLVAWNETIYPAGVAGASGLGKEFTAIAVGLAVATLYAAYRFATHGTDAASHPIRLSLSGESVGLAALLVFGAAITFGTWPRESTPAALTGELGEVTSRDIGPQFVSAKVLFETPDFQAVLSSVNVTGDGLYFGAERRSGFRAGGAVFRLDRATGQETWRFTDDGGLKPVFATPTISGGQVFIGEGLHSDTDCRLFRLDASTGKPSWSQPVATASHTEGSPRVVAGKVYFSAGDDGLYCVRAADGKEVWHVRGTERKLHIDTPPAVAQNRVFAGSGYRTFALLALDAATGSELWRTPVNLRSFGPPLVLGDRVVYGLGTGNLMEDVSAETEEGAPPEAQPAGAVVCVEAATGRVVWRFDTPKSVHTALAADARAVYAACRDGSVYALDRQSGELRWKRSLGAPLTAGPALATYAGGAFTLAVYAVSSEGLFACLSAADGRVYWHRDLPRKTDRAVQVLSTPTVVSADAAGARRHVYFGATLTTRNNGAKSAAVFRVEDAVGE
jgi:outer membrane protein assembly factor BamB